MTNLDTSSGKATIYSGWNRVNFLFVLTGFCLGKLFLMSLIYFHAIGSTYKLSESGAHGGDFPIWSRPVLVILNWGIIPFVLIAMVQRIRNLGMSAWAILWFVVPFMNIWIGWRMAACPAGYHQLHNLDSNGKVISWLFPTFVVFLIALNLVAANLLKAIT